jgi:nicotinamidase-related amidase
MTDTSAQGTDTMMAARQPLSLVIICLMLAMMVTSCGHKSVSSAPTNITAAPTAASTPGSRPLTLDPARTAVLVMDMEQFVIGILGSAAQATLAHTAAAEHTSRQAGVSVVFVATSFAPGYPEISPNNKTFAGIAGTGKLIQGSAETRLDPRIAPVGDEPVIVKHQVGAFSAPPLEQLLRAKNIDTLVLAGLFTRGVVLSTVEAAADLNYRLIVLSDCVADPDAEVNRVLLDKVLPTGADVIDSAQYTRTLNP